MTIPNITLRNGSTTLPLVPSSAYDVLTFDTGTPSIKADVAAALEAGERVADGDWHEPCGRYLKIASLGATDEAAEASANALVAFLRKYGTILEVAGSEPLSTTVRSVSVAPGEWNADTLIQREQGYIVHDYDLVTDPYWYGAEVDASGYTLDDIPAQFVFENIPGEVPALTRLKFTCDDDLPAAGFMAIGLRSFDASGDASGYDCIDDYSGAADANALGGAESATLTMTTAWQDIATPPDIDTAANEGRYAIFARVECSAATATVDATTDYRAVSTVTGNAIAVSTSSNGDTVDAALGTGEGFEVKPLGELNIPAGAIPDVATGSGWGDETAFITQATADATAALTTSWATQSLTLTGGDKLHSIILTAGESSDYDKILAWLTSGAGGTGTLYGVGYREGGFVSGEAFTLSFGSSTPLPATGTYYLNIRVLSGTFSLKRSSASTYAGGAWGEGGDLTMTVYTQVALGFNSKVAVQATSTKSSKTAQVDYLVRVPTDEGYACIVRDFAAAEGAMFDESSPLPHKHNIYLVDADGIGPSLLAQATEWRGSLMLRPGYNVYTVAAYTPVAAAPGGGTAWAWYRPRYLTCGS